MKAYYENGTATVYLGDCLDVMRGMEENSVDTVITDPPAGISFMNKKWDSNKGGRDQWIAWLTSVLEECYRVMKPGGALLIWSIPKTSHWTGTAVENAGFRVIDVIQHVFGSGFPKSHSISKALDRVAGAERTETEWRDRYHDGRTRQELGSEHHIHNVQIAATANSNTVTLPATPAAKLFDGWGTALKPAAEFWWLAYKPREGTYAQNALEHGVAGLWIDGGRVATNWKTDPTRRGWQGGNTSSNYDGGSTSIHPGCVPGHKRVSQPNHKGRWPANLILSHTSPSPCFCAGNWAECPYCGGTGVVPGCRRVGTRRVMSNGAKPAQRTKPKQVTCYGEYGDDLTGERVGYSDADGLETVDAYECVPGCAVRLLGKQSGIGKSGGNRKGELAQSPARGWKMTSKAGQAHIDYNDQGTAARFFLNLPPEALRFYYCPKASRKERNKGLEGMKERPKKEIYGNGLNSATKCDPEMHTPEGVAKRPLVKNHHPCVKPLGLMQYLCRLTKTPTGGIVLDPFMGSGTTLLVAQLEGRSAIGIEREQDYCDIAVARLKAQAPIQLKLEELC